MNARRHIIATVLLAACLVLPGVARAGVGVGTDLGRIRLTRPVSPGQRVALSPITIQNTGDVASVYRMEIIGDGARPAPAAWFACEPELFTLQPGRSQVVETVMRVPFDAKPGTYACIIVGRPEAAPGTQEYRIAAGPRLSVQVAPAPWWQAGWYGAIGWLQDAAPWSYLGAVAIAAAAIVAAATINRARPRRRRADRPSEPSGMPR